MSYSLYSNTYRNNYNNPNQFEKKNPSSSPPPSSQLNSAGRIASTPINYHFLQKEKEREKEKQEKNINKDDFFNQQKKSLIPNSFISNYRPNPKPNINTYRKSENNKNNNDIFNNNIENNNSNNISYYQNNYLRKNYQNNNYLNRNNQDNKEIKLQSNLIPQNQIENEKTQRAKTLMDDFEKKLYDTVSNFGPKHINKENKMKNFENEKEGQREPTPNLNANYKKRNLSYDKFSRNNINNNNYNQNYQRSTLQNTDTLYKNYFGNNNVNIHTINPNENNNNNYHNNNYLNYNNKNNNIRNQKNSVDKVMLNKYQSPSFYRKTPNKEGLINIKQTKNYYLKNYSSFTLGGADAFKHPKTNQDSFLTKEDSNNFIFGVFDGHGFEGHLVSQAIKTYLNNNLTSSSFSSNENIISIFKSLSSSINSSTSFNPMESGSTVVLTFISDNIIICANCGDSRAILITDENKIIPLSRDHKPDLPEEKRRILESGGRVDQIYGMGPFRVWFKDADYPGLAMSRSIGDGYAHKVGVIDLPEILVFPIDEVKPKAIILASDGVFEFVKNEDIKNIIGKYFYNMDSKECAKEIVQHSRNIWENSGYAIDDITCVVGFFDS